MAGDFSTLKNNQASDKFYMVRMYPERYLNDLLTSIGGGKYTVTLTYITPDQVREQATQLTEVATVDLVVISTWHFDASTNLLTVYPATAPADANSIICRFPLYFTEHKMKRVGNIEYLPRIKQRPAVIESMKDVTAGSFRVSISNMTLINDNHEFENYLTDNDSFNKKDVEIDIAIDDTDNFNRIFRGQVIEVKLNGNRISFRMDDALSKILEPCFMGDDSSEVYFNLQDFPDMDPSKNGRPIPYIIGKSSRYRAKFEEGIGNSSSYSLDPDTMLEAVCTDFEPSNISSTTNRTWGVCRVSVDGLFSSSFVPTSVVQDDPNVTEIRGTGAEIAKFFTGDTVLASPGLDYGRVVRRDDVTPAIFLAKNATQVAGQTITMTAGISVVITDKFGVDWFPLLARDYTIGTLTLTSGGNRYVSFTFQSNMEANIGMTILDPTSHKVSCRVSPLNTNSDHGFCVRDILTGAGLTTNAAAITAANSALAADCNFHIPNFDETDYKTSLKYIEDILESTLGYIYTGGDTDIFYKIFSTPSATQEITDTDVLEGSFAADINYRDIVTKIIAFNPHFTDEELLRTTSASPSVTASSNKAEQLHGINKTVRFRHVLQVMNTSLANIIKVRAERRVNYRFRTKAQTLENNIGDDLKINKDGILGGDSTKDVTIVAVDKSPERTIITTTDLYNL